MATVNSRERSENNSEHGGGVGGGRGSHNSFEPHVENSEFSFKGGLAGARPAATAAQEMSEDIIPEEREKLAGFIHGVEENSYNLSSVSNNNN